MRKGDLSQSACTHNTLLIRALQLVLVLTIFKATKAGYYISDAYQFFIENGWYDASDLTEDANPLSPIGTAATLGNLCVIFFGIKNWEVYFYRLRNLILPVVLSYFYVAVSGTWSDVALITFIEVLKNLIFVISLPIILVTIGPRRATQAFIIAVLLISLGSVFLSIRGAEFRTSLGADGWRGLFGHKNGLAAFCLFSIITICGALASSKRRTLGYATIGILIGLLILSQGKTAIALSIIFTLVMLLLSPRLNNFSATAVNVGLYMTPFAIIGIYVCLPLLTWFSGYTFTGRTLLWEYFYDLMRDDFLWGLGGYSLKLDYSIAANAISSVGLPSPDSSVVVMTINYGFLAPFLHLAMVSPLIRSMSQRSGYLAISALTLLYAYICYGCMESDVAINFSYAYVCLVFIGLQSQSQSIGNRTTRKYRLANRRSIVVQ